MPMLHDAGLKILDTTPDEWRDCDSGVVLAQIGKMNLMAISGLRAGRHKRGGVTLPVGRDPESRGYWYVTVDLAANDTYTVRRIWTRDDTVEIRGEMTGVYCEELGDVAYYASCWVNVNFPLDGSEINSSGWMSEQR